MVGTCCSKTIGSIGLPTFVLQSHQRMVSGVAWGGEMAGKGYNLFTAGFDRKVLGWHIILTKENIAHGKQ